jgi:hypothetical protein
VSDSESDVCSLFKSVTAIDTSDSEEEESEAAENDNEGQQEEQVETGKLEEVEEEEEDNADNDVRNMNKDFALYFLCLSSAEVKNACSYTFTPPVCLHVMVFNKEQDMSLWLGA